MQRSACYKFVFFVMIHSHVFLQSRSKPLDTMRRAAGNAIGFLGRGSSQFTLVIGVVYMWYHHPKFALKYSECGWSDEAGSQWVDCNQEWASNFGMASLPFMTPLLVGLIGVFMYRPVLLQVQGFPRNFLQYGIWLVFQGIFANFGYCGKLGVMNGYFSVFVGILAFIGQITGLETDRMLKLKGSKVIDCVGDDPDPSRSMEDMSKIQDYYPWTLISALFCPIFGGMGVYHSYNVQKLKKKKDLNAARLSSARAAKWGLWAIMVGMVILGSATIIGLTNGRVAPQPIEEDDGDDYGYGDVGDDGDDGDDGDAGDDDGDTKEDETAERRLHLRQHHA
ncbi:unnamed protein product [Durusdinium trenchii]|uniref:Uncharacterized protein n=1 Tax=Durusdinium trenchii TaxID=1381693 RepID=A0ABP0SXH8_9DINO